MHLNGNVQTTGTEYRFYGWYTRNEHSNSNVVSFQCHSKSVSIWWFSFSRNLFIYILFLYIDSYNLVILVKRWWRGGRGIGIWYGDVISSAALHPRELIPLLARRRSYIPIRRNIRWDRMYTNKSRFQADRPICWKSTFFTSHVKRVTDWGGNDTETKKKQRTNNGRTFVVDRWMKEYINLQCMIESIDHPL